MTPFAYWDSDDHAPIRQFVAEWRGAFPDFRVFGDDTVVPLIRRHFPEDVGLFTDLAIPAAKADIALLLLLHEFGGLWVVCHLGLTNAVELRRIMARLATETEAIFVDRHRAKQFRDPGRAPPPGTRFLINGILFSRPEMPLLLMICAEIFTRLRTHRDLERSGHVPYHVGELTGGEVVTSVVLSDNRGVREDFADRISIISEELVPVRRHIHRTYGQPWQSDAPRLHWTVRQGTERLFHHGLTMPG